MALTFDGVNKLIILDRADISVQEIYSRWVDWIALSDNLKYLPAIRYVGGDAISAVKNLGITYFMINGWRIRPMEANHRLTISGNLYTDPSGSSPFVDTLGAFNVTIEMAVSSLVDSTVAQLPEIQQSVFQEVIHIDQAAGAPGTEYPLGTPQYPSNNLADAKVIAASRGFDTFHILGNFTAGATDSLSGFHLVGEGPENTVVTLTSGCSTHRTTFEEMSISGRQAGETHYKRCDVGALDNVHCIFNQCRLIGPMVMSTTSTDTTSLFQCYTAEIAGAETVIDLNNSRVSMVFNDFNGKLRFTNLNHASAGVIVVNGNAGKVTIDPSCTTGTIKVRGSMEVVNNSAGTSVDNDVTSNLVWSHAVEGTFTAEEILRLLASAMAGKVTGAETTTVHFRDLADSKDRITATVDADGNRTAITHDVQ